MKMYLNYNELQQVCNITLPVGKKHLKRVLDMFLFSCYTGVGAKEIARIDSNAVKRTINRTWLVVGDRELPISMLFATKPQRLLRDYNYTFEKVAPVTNDEFMELTAVVEELTDIKIELNFDVARLTFAQCLLEKLVNVSTIQKLLGHSTIEQTRQYLDLE